MKESLIDLWNDLTPWERSLCIRLLSTTLKTKYNVPKGIVTEAGLVAPIEQEALFQKMLTFEKFELYAVYQFTGERNLMSIAFQLHKTRRISYRLMSSIDVVSKFFQKVERHLGKYKLEIAAYQMQSVQSVQ